MAFLPRTVFWWETPSPFARLQPLRLPLGRASGTALVAVVRVEVGRAMESRVAAQTSARIGQLAQTLLLTLRTKGLCAVVHSKLAVAEATTEAAHAVAAAAQLPGIHRTANRFRRISIQRKFYRALLSQVREEIPPSLPLSITALASWCICDNWLDDLPPSTTQSRCPQRRWHS